MRHRARSLLPREACLPGTDCYPARKRSRTKLEYAVTETEVMKQAPLWSAVVGVGLFVTGCQDGSEESGCVATAECAPGYVCDLEMRVCTRSRESCSAPDHCGTNETCSAEGVCRVGDCFFHGCVSGFDCTIVERRYACVSESALPNGGAGGVAADGPDSSPAGRSSSSDQEGAEGNAGAAGSE